jgi:hypothetical protein
MVAAVSQRMSVGRVHLLGDAAHQFPPAGEQTIPDHTRFLSFRYMRPATFSVRYVLGR